MLFISTSWAVAPVPPEQDLSHLAPEILERRLGDLVRRYVQDRSAALARSVVSHIETLIGHPQVRDPALCCAYRRLAAHWRWLAAQHPDSEAVPTDRAR